MRVFSLAAFFVASLFLATCGGPLEGELAVPHADAPEQDSALFIPKDVPDVPQYDDDVLRGLGAGGSVEPIRWRLTGKDGAPQRGLFRVEGGGAEIALPARHVLHSRGEGRAVVTIVDATGRVLLGEIDTEESPERTILRPAAAQQGRLSRSESGGMHVTLSQQGFRR